MEWAQRGHAEFHCHAPACPLCCCALYRRSPCGDPHDFAAAGPDCSGEATHPGAHFMLWRRGRQTREGELEKNRRPVGRKRRTNERLIVTNCAGCTSLLQKMAPTCHIVDLLFWKAQQTLACKARFSRAPFTYINRMRLKRRLQKRSFGNLTRERPVRISRAKKVGFAVSSIVASSIGLCALLGVCLAGFAVLLLN